ncbi:zf-TFIIB domain-containing protein [Candidatus Riflebacteria bacterium]
MSEKICCPKCEHSSECKVYILPGDIEVDYCPVCDGVWFDQGEVAEKLEFSRDFPDFQQVLENAKETKFTCPRCSVNKLLEMQFIPEDPLLIDCCPDCKGIWLDGGELYSIDKISRRQDLKKINLLKVLYTLKTKVKKPRKYRCPNCKTNNMYTFETSEAVKIELCQDCKGIWFDAGEAARTIELASDIPEFEQVYKQKKTSMKDCPKCIKKYLVEFPFSTRFELLIDYCETCHGLWLDPGEFEKLEELANDLEAKGNRLYTARRELQGEGWLK